MKMLMTIGDSSCFELEVSESTENNWGEIVKAVDVPAICIEKSQKDKDPTTIDYSLLL